MNEPIDTDSEGNPLTLSEIIYTDDTIADDLDTKIKIEKLRTHIRAMPNTREKEIIIRRYGLDGNAPETQREIAKRLQISLPIFYISLQCVFDTAGNGIRVVHCFVGCQAEYHYAACPAQ